MGKSTFEILSKKRYIITLFAVFSILLILATIFYYYYEKSDIRRNTIDDLRTFGVYKVNQIQEWNKERLADANAITSNESFVKSLELFLRKGDTFNKKIIKDQLSLLKANIVYKDIILAAPNGKLLFSFNADLDRINPKAIGFVKEAVTDKKIITGEIYYSKTLKEINIDYVAPIISKDHKVIAAIILRINPKTYLYPLIQSNGSNSSLYTTVLIKREGDNACFLNEVKDRSNSQLNFKISLKRTSIPAVQAVLGHKGIIDGVDYLGNKVISYVAPIKGTDWFLEIKANKNDIYSNLTAKVFFVTSFRLLAFLLVVFGLVLIYQYRQKIFFKELFAKEKELRENHEEFRTILYSIGDGVITADTFGKIKKMNHTAENLTGWNEADAVGKPIEDVFKIINESTRAKVDNPIFRVLTEGVIVGLANHTLLISKDGKEIPISDSGAPIRDDSGKVDGVVLIFRDKTEEHKTEKIIRQNEARLRRAELASKSGNWELHLDSKTMIASEGAAKIYGVDWKEVDYELVKKVPLIEYRPIMDNALKNLIENNISYNIEFKIKTIDTGEIKDIYSIAEYDKENKILFGVIQDVTIRKKAEESLREREAFLNNLIDTIPIPVFYKDNNLKYIGANEAFVKLFGYTKEQIKGKTVTDIYEPELAQIYVAQDKALINSGGLQIYESKFKDANGSNHDVINYKATYSNNNYKNAGIIGAILDITDRKKAEEEIRTILRTAIDGFYLVDMNGKILETNDSYCSMVGYSRNELLTMSIKDIDVIDNENDIRERLEIIRTKGFYRFETKHRRKDGKIIDVDASVNYLKTENEKVFVFMRDITERKQAEEAILRNKERWESLFNNSPAAIAVYQAVDNGNDFIFTDFNLTAQKIDNFNINQVIGKRLSVMFPSVEKLGFLDTLRKVWHTGKTEYINFYYNDERIEGWRENIIYKLNTGEIVSIFNDVTDRMKGEISLRESEERFRTVYSVSPDGISISEIDTGFLFEVNEAYKNVFDFSQEEVIGKTSLEIGIWVDENDRKELISDLHQHGLYNNKEINFKKKNGTIIHTLVSGRIITINQKKFMLTVVKDITEIYKIGQSLKESEARLKTTLYSIGDGVITTDKFGKINRMNPVAENLTGWKEHEAKGKPLEEVFKIINEGTRNSVENPVHKVLKDGQIIGLANHTILLSKSGIEIPIADSGAPIRNESGEIEGVVLVFRDQLKERAAQKILEESEAQLKQSQKVARIGYYIFEISTGQWVSSEMLDEIFGIDKNYKRDVEGWLNIIDPEDREEMSDYLNDHILTKQKEFDKKYKIRNNKNNSVIWVHGLGSLEYDANGKLIKMFGTIQDITERMETQSIIENSLKEKEILLKEVHHRVKNNFQQIIALISLQSEFIEDKTILDIFDDLSHRLLAMSLIHELMYGTGNFVAVDISDYIEKLSSYLVQTYASSKKITLKLDLENHNLSLDSIIPCGLIINEILTNSIKYAFPNNSAGQINISFKKKDGIFYLDISNDGIGLKKDLDIENLQSLGLRLIRLLSLQLRGNVEIIRPEKGLRYEIKFKGIN